VITRGFLKLSKGPVGNVVEVFGKRLFKGFGRRGLFAVTIGSLCRIVFHFIQLIVIEVGRVGFGHKGAKLAIIDIVRPWLGKFTGCVVTINQFPSVAAFNLVINFFVIAYIDVFL